MFWSLGMNVNEITITELSEITGLKKPQISLALKEYSDKEVTRVNKRITGISPNAVEKFLLENEIDIFTSGIVTLVANLCGGVGKTTSVFALAAAMRRTTNLKTAVIMIDGDSQGSLSSLASGGRADDEDPTLVDYLEGKARLNEILTDLGDNVWIIKANLSLVILDKFLQKPKETKEKILRLYNDIFKKFGPTTKIIQDHGPQLSNLFASSICALHQLPLDILKTVLVPIRSDEFAIQGAEIIIEEIDDLKQTFGLNDNDVEIRCFFSNIDKRVGSTAKAIKAASDKELILEHLCESAIRYSAEIPKSIMDGVNIFDSTKAKTKASQDYSQLLVEIFGTEEIEVIE